MESPKNIPQAIIAAAIIIGISAILIAAISPLVATDEWKAKGWFYIFCIGYIGYHLFGYKLFHR